jgi:hypothetical protein
MITKKTSIGKFTKVYCRIYPRGSESIKIALIKQHFFIFRIEENDTSVERKTNESDDELASNAFKKAEDWIERTSAYYQGRKSLSAAIKRGHSITQRLKEM